MADMVNIPMSQQIEEMDIDDLRTDFFSLMGSIVAGYGDNLSSDQQDAGAALPGLTEENVQTMQGAK